MAQLSLAPRFDIVSVLSDHSYWHYSTHNDFTPANSLPSEQAVATSYLCKSLLVFVCVMK